MSENPRAHAHNSWATPNWIPSAGAVALGGPCRRYGYGHSIHPIHARHLVENPWVAAEILAVDGEWITFRTDAGEERRWNHDPDLLQAMHDIAVLEPGVAVEWSPSYKALSVTMDGRGLAVTLCADTPIACVPWDPIPQTE